MPITYQTIINEINQIPVAFLQDVYQIVHNYQVKVNHKDRNRDEILKFAGAWSDMSDSDFMDMTNEMKKNENDLFNREVEL